MTQDKPWLKHYDAGVPHTLEPYPQRTLLDVVHDTAHERPDHTALIFKGSKISYAELERLTDAFAAALLSLGVQKGDRVGLLLPNSPQSVIGQLGTWKAGGIAACLNPMYTEHELEYALNECGAETVLVLAPYYGKIRSIQGRTGIRRIIVTGIREYLPPLKRFLFALLQERQTGHRVQARSGDLTLAGLLRAHRDSPRPDIPVLPQDPALLLFSGGTTGTPKAALGTHHALLAAGMQVNAWFSGMLTDWEDILALVMPLFHVYGNVGVLSTGLVGHSPLAVVPDPRNLDDVLNTIRRVRPAFIPGVPTFFNALLRHPDVQAGKVDFEPVKLCIAGAAALLAETKNRFESLTGGRVVEGYALTESMMAAIITPLQGLYKPGAVGIPLPDVEVQITGEHTGEDNLPPGKVGEILIRAPQLMAGYWQRPEETAHILRHGWLHTGDLGYMDDDGYVFIVDRGKDVIKPSGFQVWPREVEEVIAAHPCVAEVGVAGVPDDYQGEAVKAWVVVKEGERLTVDDIRACCREKLVGYKVPKHVEFLESLPKSTVGKVLRRELVSHDQGDKD